MLLDNRLLPTPDFPPVRSYRRRVLLAGAALLLCLLAILGWAVQSNFSRLKQANRWNIHTYQVLERINRVSTLLDMHEALLRGFALTGDANYLRQLRQSNGIGLREIEALRQLTRDRPLQQDRLVVIRAQYGDYKARFVAPYMCPDLKGDALVQRTLRAQIEARGRAGARLQTRLHEMELTERTLIEARASELIAAQHGTAYILILCSIFVVVLAVGLTFLLGRAVQSQQLASGQLRALNQSLVTEISERRLIEESLRASETAFRHLAEDSLDMICRHAPDGTLTYVSPSVRPLLGYDPAEMVGIHPARFRFDKNASFEAMSDAQSFAAQLRHTKDKPLLRAYRNASGGKVWLEVVGHAIVDSESGEVRAWHTSARDVSARVREENERARLLVGLRAIVEIADELIAAPTEDELLRRAVALMRQRVGLERCSIYLALADETADDAAEMPSQLRGTYGTDENGDAIAENALFYDLQNAPDSDDIAPALGERWIVRRNQTRHIWRNGERIELPGRGWLARTPILTRNRLVGLFFHDSADTDAAHDAVDQQLITVFCSFLGALIERGRSQAHMNRQQRLLHSVMENAPLFLYSVDTESKFTLATGKILPTIGLDAAHMLGRPMTDFAAPDSPSLLNVKRALNGETLQQEMEFGGRWLKMWRQPLRDDEGAIVGMIGIGMDITQQHRAQCALQESEARYRQVADALQDVLFQTDARGYWTFLNPAWAEITGHDVESSLAAPANKWVHPDDRAEFDTLLDAAKTPISLAIVGETNDATQRVFRFNTRGQATRWIEVTLRANFSAEGVFVGTAGTLSDVTEKVISENALRETLELKRAILQGASYAIISTDENGIIQTFNPAAERLLGVRAAEVVGHLTPEFFHDPRELRARAEQFAQEFGAEPQSAFEVLTMRGNQRGQHESEWNCVRSDGTIFPMRISHSVLKGPDGAVTGHVAIGYDLTETRRTENLKNEFVSVVSHELRTPLTSIRGALGLLSGGVAGALPPSASQMIDIAQKNADRLVLLINDILDIEKIESGKMRFEKNEVSLPALLENALEANRGYAQTLGVRIELEPLAPALNGATIAGDEARLQQVMSNLISNACKWTPTGTAVQLRALLLSGEPSENARVVIEVQDAGPGVPPEFESRLFERFSQADGSATRGKGGTGLGLAVTQAIVEKHGGCVSYRAPDLQNGRVGATFCFEIPVRHLATSVSTFASTSMADAPRTKMLVIEDDEEVAAVTRAILEDAGYAVEVAHSRAAALQLARRACDDGVCFAGATLDLHLPDGHGLQLLEELRALPGAGALPVVVISAFCDEHDPNETRHRVERWFAKPVAPAQLLSAIAGWNSPNGLPNGQTNNGNSDGKARVLHVEDDVDVRRVVELILDGSSHITTAASLSQARQKIRDGKFDLALIDIGLPDGNGLDLVEPLANQQPPVPTILFSAREAEAEAASNVAAALIKSRTPNEALRAKVEELLAIKRD